MEYVLEDKLEEARALVEEKNYYRLKEILNSLLVPDIVEIISSFDINEQVVMFRLLNKDVATEVFSMMEHEYQEELLTHFGREEVKNIIEGMDPDDRTELFDELPQDMVKRLIRLLSPSERQTANRLLNYPEESAGRLMTPEFIELHRDLNCSEAIDLIRQIGMNKETIYYLYVVDERGILIGIVSLKDVLLANPSTRVQDIMTTNFISGSTTDDQEEVARLLAKYDISALPITDRDNKLVGIVTIDDVIDVINEEATEDFHKMASMEAIDEPYFSTRFFVLGRKRALWLVILLVTSYLSSSVLKYYSGILEVVVPLAFFIPMLTGTCGNTGMQSATLVIRGMATGEIKIKDSLRIFTREVFMGLFLGVILGIFAFIRANFLQVNPFVGISVGCAVFISVILSNIIGSFLPMILRRVGIDPAISAGPFLTTIIDVTTLILYFEIAKMILETGM